MNLLAHINFNAHEWQAIKRWLEEERKQQVSKLIGHTDEVASNKTRGAIYMIDKLLNAEKDAAIAASREENNDRSNR